MKQTINEFSDTQQKRAFEVLEESRIAKIWKSYGCKVNLIGSLKMGLLVKHRDIDLHVYSSGITIDFSFGIMAKVAENPKVAEVKCINGLHTDEHCVAWHVLYKATENEVWQIDIIHIEEGSQYDGFFERMAARITEVASEEQLQLIRKLKYETPDNEKIHGVEYYEGVIDGGVKSLEELREWVARRRAKEFYYWMP